MLGVGCILVACMALVSANWQLYQNINTVGGNDAEVYTHICNRIHVMKWFWW